MDKVAWSVVMRHRVLLRDGSLFIGVIAAFAAVAFLFDVAGTRSQDPQVTLNELLTLGILVGAGIAWFGWRRIIEQEQQLSAKSEAERHAEFLAHHDHLTGLPNRRRLQQELQLAVETPPISGAAHVLLLLDLNGFKKVNDVFGHARGDAVLSTVARRISDTLPANSLLARMGGDEFAIVVRNQPKSDLGSGIAKKVIGCLAPPVRLGSDEHPIGTGIGIALIPDDGTHVSELMRRADVALYKAKSLDGSTFIHFNEEMDRETHERNLLQRELADAVAQKAIVPFFQPIVDLSTGDVRAFEALARWSHPTLGSIPPDRFIPLAEESGLISELSDHLLRLACIAALEWPSYVTLSFNVSPAMLRDQTLGLRVLHILASSGLSPKRLELEITESAIMRDLDIARESLEMLHAAGLRIVLDDFGTGSTSLTHLRSFKFDGLKIDRQFVNLMLEEGESAAIVRAVLGLAKGLGLTIVAEGVEQLAQSRALQHEGCTTGQGFHYSKAVPAYETSRFFEAFAEMPPGEAVSSL